MAKDVVLLGETYSWWDNEEDHIYNEQSQVWLANVLFKGTRQSKQCPVVIVVHELALDIDVMCRIS